MDLQNGSKKIFVFDRPWDETAATWTSMGWEPEKENLTPAGKFTAASAGAALKSWESFTVTEAVKNQLADPASNHGFMIVMDGVFGGPRHSIQYCSSEHENQSLRPKLMISYSGGTAVGMRGERTAGPLKLCGTRLTAAADFQNGRMAVIDLRGKVLCEQPLTAGESVELSQYSLAPGTYIVKTTGSGVVRAAKFTVTNTGQ